MDFTEKTVSTKEIFKGKMINLELLTVELPDGNRATREIVRHPGAAVIIPLTEENEILMVRQFRKTIDKCLLELPAGKLDPGETPEQCAARELKEETGCSAADLKYLMSIHTSPGFSNEVLHLFVATGLTEGDQKTDADEFVSTEKISIKKLLDMVYSGEITDAKTIIGIMAAEKIIEGELAI